MRLILAISSRDRPTELGLLLQSLREQTYQDFDIAILDDASGTPLTSFHFILALVNRLKFEGHNVQVTRTNQSRGVSIARQTLVEYIIKHNPEATHICRVDDDTILDRYFLERLVQVLDAGYDLASGVTPPMMNPIKPRSITHVGKVINRVVLDHEGRFLYNGDDCGHTFLESAILPADHFRSSLLYPISLHTEKQVWYEDTLTACGFREEQFLSIRALLEGLTIGVHTQAIAWHLLTPSGGDRRTNYNELAHQNQLLLNRFVRKVVKKHGNFIEAYHKEQGIVEELPTQLANQHKQTNLIYHNQT